MSCGASLKSGRSVQTPTSAPTTNPLSITTMAKAGDLRNWSGAADGSAVTMARYIAMRSIYGAPAGSCPEISRWNNDRRHPGNAQSSPGNHALGFGWTDVVWPALTNAPNNILSPLDAAAWRQWVARRS